MIHTSSVVVAIVAIVAVVVIVVVVVDVVVFVFVVGRVLVNAVCWLWVVCVLVL